MSRISGAFVIGRKTAFTYKGKPLDLKQIGRELNVRYVLEGSVQRGGNRMRVNVQLIEPETGAHLWADRFDKASGRSLRHAGRIVARLANALEHIVGRGREPSGRSSSASKDRRPLLSRHGPFLTKGSLLSIRSRRVSFFNAPRTFRGELGRPPPFPLSSLSIADFVDCRYPREYWHAPWERQLRFRRYRISEGHEKPFVTSGVRHEVKI